MSLTLLQENQKQWKMNQDYHNRNHFRPVKLTVLQLVKKLHVLWNLKVCYRVCKSPPPASIMNQMNPVQTLPHYSLKFIFISSFCQFIHFPSTILLLSFPTTGLCSFFSSPTHVTHPSHLIPLQWITLTILRNSIISPLWNPREAAVTARW
jgi:hypothetical protein